MKQKFLIKFGIALIASVSNFCIPLHAQSVPENIQKAFSIFAVQSPYRHRFERFSVENKKLEINLWYEDASVIKRGEPTDALFCRISHMLIFGRHKERSSSKTTPLNLAFQELPDLEAVNLTFFDVLYTNKPMPADANPAKLRVVWTREEKIIPYLSYSISRGEWKTLGKILQTFTHMNFENYQEKLCANVIKIAPNLKANFKPIQDYLAQTREGQRQ